MLQAPTVLAGLTAAIETVANQALELDAASQESLAKLEDIWIETELRPLGLRLFFGLGYPLRVASVREEPCELSIRGTPGAFLRLLQGEHQADGLSLQGDIAIAQKLSAIAASLDIDWEASLARHIGELPAHLLSTPLRRLSSWMQYSASQFGADAEEYLHHEQRSLPSRDEVNYWAEQVEQLRMTGDRLEARIRALETRLRPSPAQPAKEENL